MGEKAWLCAVAMAAWGCGSSNLEKAVSRAEQGGDRPLVVMATADWCGPCHSFKKYVLPAPQVQRALGDVEFVMLNDKDSQGSLRKLGVRSFPTFLVVTRDERVVAAVPGAMDADRFVDFLAWGAANYFSADEVERLATGSSARGRLYAARWLAMNGGLERARTLYQSTLDQLEPDEAWRRAQIEWELTLARSVGADGISVAQSAVTYVAKYPDSPEVLEAVRFALLSGGLQAPVAAAFASRSVEILSDNPQALNGLVYVLLAADLTEPAIAAGKRQIELAPDDANAYDTLAEAFSYAGQTEQALVNADKAIARAPKSDSRAQFESNRERYAERRPSPSVDQTRERFRSLMKRYQITAGVTF